MSRLLAALLALSVFASAAAAADNLPIVVYLCPRAEAPPQVDAQLDDPCWQASPLVDSLTDFGRESAAPVQTLFRATYDDAALYLAITCDEPTPERVAISAAARDAMEIFRQEAVEVFLDPGHTHRRFYQLGINAAGSLYDLGPESGTAWDGGIAVAAARGNQAWYLELAIPWQGLGVTPQPGQIHGLNVCRDRYIGVGQPWSSWARVMGTFHDPIRFGHLVLTQPGDDLARFDEELRKDGRTGQVSIAHAGQSDSWYRGLLQAALDRLDKQLAELRALGEAEQDPAAREAVQARLAPFAAEASQAREALAAKDTDPETLALWEFRVSRMLAAIADVMWQARLDALLSGI